MQYDKDEVFEFRPPSLLEEDGSQRFTGVTMAGYSWSVTFTAHLMIIRYREYELMFVDKKGWDRSEKKRKELIKDFFHYM